VGGRALAAHRGSKAAGKFGLRKTNQKLAFRGRKGRQSSTQACNLQFAKAELGKKKTRRLSQEMEDSGTGPTR